MAVKRKINSSFCLLSVLLLGIVFGLGFLCGKTSSESQSYSSTKVAVNAAPTVEMWADDNGNYNNKKETRKINLNNASYDELIAINSIDGATAEKIIKFREEYGGFNELRELVELGLISQSQAYNVKDYVSVEFP